MSRTDGEVCPYISAPGLIVVYVYFIIAQNYL